MKQSYHVDWKKIGALMGAFVVLAVMAYGATWLRSNKKNDNIQNAASTYSPTNNRGEEDYLKDSVPEGGSIVSKVKYFPYDPNRDSPGDDTPGELTWGSWAAEVKKIVKEDGRIFLVVDEFDLFRSGGSCRTIGGMCAINYDKELVVVEADKNAMLTLNYSCESYGNDPTYSEPVIKHDGLGVGTQCSVKFDETRDIIGDYDFYWLDFDSEGKVINIVNQYRS